MALFALVVEAKGFSAAARRSGTPQATVSRRIAALERAMGLDLIDRTTRRMTLTEAGRRVYAHARLIRDQADAAQAAVTEISGVPVPPSRTKRFTPGAVCTRCVVNSSSVSCAWARPGITRRNATARHLKNFISLSLASGRPALS